MNEEDIVANIEDILDEIDIEKASPSELRTVLRSISDCVAADETEEEEIEDDDDEEEGEGEDEERDEVQKEKPKHGK